MSVNRLAALRLTHESSWPGERMKRQARRNQIGRLEVAAKEAAGSILMLLTNAYDPDPRVRNEALALVRAGYRVRILAWDRDERAPAAESVEGVEVERVHVASLHGRGMSQILFYALVYLKMLWRAARARFDVVHCHDLDALPLGFVLAVLKRRPLVYDAHESFPDMLVGSVPKVVIGCLRQLETMLIRRTSLLITVGEKLRRHFVERGARRSVVVGNWKDLAAYSRTTAQNREVRRSLGIPAGALAIVCITQLLRDRQLRELLDAIDSVDDVYAVIGGRGALEGFIKERAATNPRIIFVGFVTADEIAKYTCAADIVYYGFDPHNPNANFSAPNKLYEALAAGRPLITGDFGEIAEMVRKAECGVVLPRYSAEAVRTAIEEMRDPRRRTALANNARACGQSSLNWAKAEEILRREYELILRPPAAGHKRAEVGVVASGR